MAKTINDELRKALDTSATSTGDVLINEQIVRELHGLVIAESPILNRVGRKSWTTNAYNFRRRLTDPAAFFLADGADLNAADSSTFERDVVMMKYIYNRVEVTGPEQYAVRDWIDIMADQINAAVRQISRKLENEILFGTSGNAAPGGLNGLINQITTNVHALPDSDGTAGDPVAPSPLYLSDIDVALDMPHYQPDTIAGPRAFGRRVNALLQAQQRFINYQDVAGGFNVMSYRGAPIYTLDNVHGADPAIANSVVLFDSKDATLVVQRETFVEKLAKVKDSDDYMVGMYCTFAVHDENVSHAKITNADFTVTNA